MPLAWALRDMRGGWKNFRLVMLCLILSIASITAIQLAGSSVLQSIRSQSNIILGADWVLREMYKPVAAGERDWLQNNGAELVDTTEMRVMLVNPRTDDATLVELKAVDRGYPLYGDIQTDPPVADFISMLDNGIVMERSLGDRLNVQIGDALKLGNKGFTLKGWIVKEPDRAGGGRFGLAPRAMITRQGLAETGLEQPGSMVYYDLRVKWPVGADQEKLKTEFLAAFKGATWKFTDTSRASPQIQRYVDNIVQFLTLIGLSSLLIGGIGVANGMRAYFQTRLTTIAIFKSVGMRIADIRQIFLWQIFIIGIAGTAIGMSIGAGAVYLLEPLARAYLPFEFNIYLGLTAFMVPLLFGILTTLIFSLLPLGEAERSSPLSLLRNAGGAEKFKPKKIHLVAIGILVIALCGLVIITSNNPMFSAYFLMASVFIFGLFYGAGQLTAVIVKLMGRKSKLNARIAFDRLGRKGNATAHTLVSLGIGLTILVSIALIQRNFTAILHDNLPADAPTFFFLDIQPDQRDAFTAIVKETPGITHPIVMPNLRGRIVSVNDVPAEKALIDSRESWLLSNDRGFTFTSDLPAHSEILDGAWWPANYSGQPIVSVVKDVQNAFAVKPGDTMTFSILGREITAKVANVRDVNWANFTINFAITFAPGALDTAPYSSLATVVATGDAENILQRKIVRAFPNVTMINVKYAIDTFSQLMGKMNIAVQVMAFITLITGLIVLVESLLAARQERKYETVVLKVIGFSPGRLRTIMLYEYVLMGGVAVGFSALFGTLISRLIIHDWMGFEWNFYPGLVAQTIMFSMMIIVGVSWLVQRGILKSSVMAQLRND